MHLMYLKIEKKKVDVFVLEKFYERFKGLKFCLEPINYIIMFPKKKFINTYFLCQNIDIVVTDKDDKILKIYENVKPEKIIFPNIKSYNIYFMPPGIGSNFKQDEVIKLKENNS